MVRWLRRSRLAQGSDQRGITVVETVTAVTLMIIVGAIVGSILVSSSRATVSLERETMALDELRIAMARIEREFRSGECVREPVPLNPGDPASGDVLRFTTRSGGGSREVVYRVDVDRLVREEGGVESAVAGSLVDGPDAFTYTETPRRSVVVQFTVQAPNGNERMLRTTVAGRNAWRDC